MKVEDAKLNRDCALGLNESQRWILSNGTYLQRLH